MKLDKCTGPFGKVVLEGSLVATFSKTTANDLHVDIVAADGTTANSSALTYAAQVDVRFDGTSASSATTGAPTARRSADRTSLVTPT